MRGMAAGRALACALGGDAEREFAKVKGGASRSTVFSLFPSARAPVRTPGWRPSAGNTHTHTLMSAAFLRACLGGSRTGAGGLLAASGLFASAPAGPAAALRSLTASPARRAFTTSPWAGSAGQASSDTAFHRPASGAAASTSTGAPARGFAAAAASAQPDLEDEDGPARPPPPSPPSSIPTLPDVPPGSRRTGLVGVKAGMTHEWDAETGARTALTVVWFDSPTVLQAKASAGPDGYDALQIGAGAARRRRAGLRGVGRPAGHAAAHGGSEGAPPRWVREFRVTPDAALPPGTRLRADHFAVGQLVDVQGTTVGKGFSGVMKKWGFKGQGASHGNSKAHRKAGGIGACQDPGKVWPGKKMAGRAGAVTRSVLSLRVAGVDAERGLIFLAGAVPGGAGSPVRVSDAVMARSRQPVARPFPTKMVG